MLESASNMSNYIESRYDGKTDFTVEVKDLVTRYTTDNIASMTFGVLTNSFKDPEFYKRSKFSFGWFGIFKYI